MNPVGSGGGFWRGLERFGDQVLDLDKGHPTAFGGPLETMDILQHQYAQWWKDSPKDAAGKRVADPMAWPMGFDPQKNPVFAHNEIDVPMTPPEVFARIVGAVDWPRRYPNSADVEIQGGGTSLRHGTKFTWTTFGTRQTSEVMQYKPDLDSADPLAPSAPPHLAIGWNAKGAGTEAFHRWILYPDGRGGTRIVTEECQRGFTPTVNAGKQNPMMHAGHQIWLESFKQP